MTKDISWHATTCSVHKGNQFPPWKASINLLSTLAATPPLKPSIFIPSVRDAEGKDRPVIQSTCTTDQARSIAIPVLDYDYPKPLFIAPVLLFISHRI